MSASNSHRAIFDAVRQIPPGCVATYGQIAHFIGHPRAARLVGYALHRCPANLPWHRVINAKGRISLPADSTQAMTQRRRLEAEGIVFVGERIDLARYGWSPENRQTPAADNNSPVSNNGNPMTAE